MGRYVQLAELKQRNGVNSDRHDDLYARAIEATEALLDRHCGRRFSRTNDVAPRFFRARSTHYVHIDDAIDVEEVATGVDGRNGSFTVTNDVVPRYEMGGGPAYLLEADTERFSTHRGAWVRVTPRHGWGWRDVPPEVPEAVIIHASRLFKRKDAIEGVAGYESTGIITLVGRRLDGDAAMLVKDLRRGVLWAP